MKSLCFALLLLSGLLPQAFAQDIHTAPLVWINCEDNPDELPVAHGIPSPEITDELKKIHEPIYVEYRLYVSGKGKAEVWDIGTTSPWIPNDFRHMEQAFLPAKRKGKPVASEVALYQIFNPSEADPKSPNAIPRLLAIYPPTNPAGNKPSSKDTVVRVKACIDAHGAVTASQAVGDTSVSFAEAAASAVRSWLFAPARHDGQPVAAELEVNIVFQEPLCHIDGGKISRAKPIERVAPDYPRYLLQARLSGEVEVSFVVNVEGRVTEVVTDSSTHPAFEDSALRAVKAWRFSPAVQNGIPISTHCVQSLVFTPTDEAHMGFNVPTPKSFHKGLPEEFQYETAPKLKHIATPVYPLEDLKAKRGGKVALAYVIGPEGGVVEVKALPGAPSTSLAAAAVAALEQYSFIPPGRKGKACYALLNIELEFSPEGSLGHAPVTDATKRALYILEKSPEKLTKADALDHQPKLRIGLPPKPSPSNAARGKVMVEFFLDRDGIPQLPHVITADEPSLGYAACQAIANWRFERPKSAGKYVDTLVRVPIEYQ